MSARGRYGKREDMLLRAYAACGVGAGQIARALGRTRESVIARAARLGVSAPDVRAPGRMETLARLGEARSLAARSSPDIRRAGRRQRLWTTGELELVRSYREAGRTCAEAAEALGRTVESVKYARKALAPAPRPDGPRP